MGEIPLFGFEFRSVDDHTGVADAGLVLHVEHFVEHDVLDHVRRDARCIEKAADEDRVVDGIVAPEDKA